MSGKEIVAGFEVYIAFIRSTMSNPNSRRFEIYSFYHIGLSRHYSSRCGMFIAFNPLTVSVFSSPHIAEAFSNDSQLRDNGATISGTVKHELRK